jgi:23S rRNA pseudouridine1911/1915/1917 synthase
VSSPARATFDFTVIDETDGWLVVNKPAPLQIHPSKPTDAGLTLWDGLRELLSYELANGGQVSLVNRLDRETSGVVLIAKSAETARLFGKAMMRRQMHKTYMAIVHGWPEWQATRLDAPILRQGDMRESRIWVKQCVHESGALCSTEFRVVRQWKRGELPFSLVEARPLTGRMHQIRVHLAHLGFPVVGDKIYGEDETCYLEFIETGWTEALAAKLLLPRHALHSQVLEVDTPELKLRWEAPLTADLVAFADDQEVPAK